MIGGMLPAFEHQDLSGGLSEAVSIQAAATWHPRDMVMLERVVFLFRGPSWTSTLYWNSDGRRNSVSTDGLSDGRLSVLDSSVSKFGAGTADLPKPR